MKYHSIFHFLLFILVVCSSHFSFSQTTRKNDLIIKRDSSRVEALILEIDEQVVKYKKYSDQEGPTFSLNKKEIASIVYGNGEVELFAAEPEIYFDESPAPVIPHNNQYKNGPITRHRGGAIQSQSTDQLKFNYSFYLKKASTYRTMGLVGTSVGLLMTAAGIITVSAAERDYSSTGYSSAYENRVTGGVLLVTAGICAGVPFSIIGLVKSRSYKKRALRTHEELRRRSEPLSLHSISPGYNLQNQSANLTIRMTF